MTLPVMNAPVMNVPVSRVMIIEDDEIVRSIHRTLVEDTPGFQVVSAVGTLAQASQDYESVNFDLLIVDIYLPDGSGLEWVQALPHREDTPDIIMITAANDLRTVQTAIRTGVMDFLIKPFSRARFQSALERHSQRRRASLGEHLTQNSVDRLLRHDPVTHLPKGIDASTLERVQQLLAGQSEAISAEQMGQLLGVSRITAWRYLEYLASRNLVVVQTQYQSPGRPLKRYASRS